MRTSILAALLVVGCTGGSPPPRTGGDLNAATFALSYRAGEGEQEIRRAQAAVVRSSGQADGYAALARAFLLRRRETGDGRLAAYAEDALIAAEARDRRDPAVRTVAILMLHDQHRFAEARTAARELQRAAPADPTGHLLEGDAALELGDYDGAAEAVQRALDLVPDLRSYGRGAYLRWLHGDVDGALELLDLAIGAAGPGGREPVAWCTVEVGEIQRRRGKSREAVAAADRALAMVPGYLPARALRARGLAGLGQRAQAIAEMSAVAAASGSAEHHLALAELLEAAGRDPSRSVAAAEKLAGHDPLPLAAYLAARGDDRALALAEQAVADRPSVFAEAVHARALAGAGRVKEAREAMAKALRLGTPAAELYLAAAAVEKAAGDQAAAARALAKATEIEKGGMR